jgi:hypothetical protein
MRREMSVAAARSAKRHSLRSGYPLVPTTWTL